MMIPGMQRLSHPRGSNGVRLDSMAEVVGHNRIPLVSVIVPAAGDLTDLPALVDGLVAQDASFPWEVVFVDNGLEPAARESLESNAHRLPRSRIVDEAVRGIGPARNAGARAAEADTIAFVDADDIPIPTWLTALADTVGDGVIAAGALELGSLNPDWLAATRGDHELGELYVCEGVFPVPPGGNMAIRASDFERLGGFAIDNRSLEDFDLALRAWENRLAVRSAGPASAVQYRLRGTPGSLFRQGYAYGNARSRVYGELWKRGLVRRCTIGGWKSWVLLVASIPPSVISPRWRGRVAWIAGNRLGRVRGSARSRVIYL